MAISADERLLASGTAEQPIHLWHLADNQLHLALEGHRHGTGALAFRPDGLVLASGGTDCLVRLWDTHQGQLLATLAGHRRPLHTLAFSPDGRLLASGGEDCALLLWDVAPYQPNNGALTPEQVAPIRRLDGHKEMIRVLAFHP